MDILHFCVLCGDVGVSFNTLALIDHMRNFHPGLDSAPEVYQDDRTLVIYDDCPEHMVTGRVPYLRDL